MPDYDLLPCGVLITDPSCKIDYCNTQLADIIGCSAVDVVGRNINDLLTKGSKILFQQIALPSVLNNYRFDEVQLNFTDEEHNKIPIILFARRDEGSPDNIFWCSFSAVERNKLLETLHDSKKELEKTNSQLANLSKTDELTGCYNRREMIYQLRMMRRQAERIKSSFAVVILDLDHFKKVNDNFGHIEGDSILKQFAQLLKNNARAGDIVVRYGGEEFVLLLPNIDTNNALIVTNRIHESMSTIETSASAVTVSIGICIVPHDRTITDSDIIDIADKALYESKNTGRNKTTLQLTTASSIDAILTPRSSSQ